MRAFITGISGQDGSYLAELLLQHGYEVHGLIRRVAVAEQDSRLWRLREILDRVTLHDGDIHVLSSIEKALKEVQPDEVYHLAAQSQVGRSFNDPFTTFETNTRGTLHVLEATRKCCPMAKVYFAGSSEQFGNAPAPQGLGTPMQPVSPYGLSKLLAWDMAGYYRRHLWIARGLLFNHESPRRGDEFVTRKITRYVKNFPSRNGKLRLGNLSPKRDWGHARDYVRAMHAMLQYSSPQDWVIGTGSCWSVAEFALMAFLQVGEDYRDHIEVDQSLLRSDEIEELRADNSKAVKFLKWKPEISLDALLKEMVEHG